MGENSNYPPRASLAPAAPSQRPRPSVGPALEEGFHDAATRRAAEQMVRASAPPAARASLPPNPVLLALEARRRTSLAPGRLSMPPGPASSPPRGSRPPRYEPLAPPGLNTRVVSISSGVPWTALALAGAAVIFFTAIAAYAIFK